MDVGKEQEASPLEKLQTWLGQNFALASFIVLLISLAVAIICTSFYFFVFDPTLIWVIEYSDMPKLFLISFSLVSAYIVLYAFVVRVFFNAKTRWARIRRLGMTGLVIFLAFTGPSIYTDIMTNSGLLKYRLMAFWCIILPLVIFIFYLNMASSKIDFNLLITSSFALFISLPAYGIFYGLYVKYVSFESVTLYTKQYEFKQATLIAWFSHHVAFYSSDNKVVILPTADVTRFVFERFEGKKDNKDNAK